ncbi:MAG TPA: type II toxin-antitoxin system RelE/ParE family toxin [Thermoanaerobaculia bacterium]|nr:type II toxin-antitoxin system RelE/ParE family toxin [Thermoanaerobaculia bacterium]
MTKLFRIDVGNTARRQIDEVNRWWRANRSAARNTVETELARVFRLILNHPYIGPAAEDVDVAEVRRIHLSRIGHYLYYRVLEAEGVVEVLAIWSDSRGETPQI